MRRVAVRTADFRLSFHLMRELKRRDCQFVMLSPDDSWDGIWLGTPEETILCEDGIPVIEDTVEAAVERAIQLSRGFSSAQQLVFGIDPGPRPGLAWLADGQLIGTAQLENVSDVISHIKGLSSSLQYVHLVVKIGDGAPLIRDRIINNCIDANFEVLVVCEAKTSRGSRNHAHIHAATRIAVQGGKKISIKIVIKASEGALKEIKRQSRILSGGRVTISTGLAKMVALGSINLEQAIKKA